MTPEKTRLTVRSCLAFMARGGLKVSLFEGTPLNMVEEMIEAEVIPAKVDKPTACAAVKEFRYEFEYLRNLPDQLGDDYEIHDPRRGDRDAHTVQAEG